MGLHISVSTEVACAVISAFVSISTALISYQVNRNKTKAEIQKAKMEIEQANMVLSIRQDIAVRKKYSAMFTAIQKFSEIPDINAKNAAISTVNDLLSEESHELRILLIKALRILEDADAFSGPDLQLLSPILNEIRIQSGK